MEGSRLEKGDHVADDALSIPHTSPPSRVGPPQMDSLYLTVVYEIHKRKGMIIMYTAFTYPASSQVLSITTDQDENITINEGEKSFIVFNITYYGVKTARPNFFIYTDKMVHFGTFTSGRSLQYAKYGSSDCDTISCNNTRNLISELYVLLIYGTLELNQSIIQCRIERNDSLCNISIFVTVRPAGREGKHLS